MLLGDLFLGLIAVLFPPIAVWIKRGLCSADSFINILLCMLGYLPGLLHAWYIIASNPEIDYDCYEPVDAESQRVTHYYITHEPGRSYGTAGQQGGNRQGQAPVPKTSTKPKSKPQGQVPAPVGQSSGNVMPPQPAGPSQGAGSDEPGAPPSYSEVVRGDNKIQSQD